MSTNSRKSTLWIPTVVACALALGVWAGFNISRLAMRAKAPAATAAPISRAASKIDLTLGLVERVYVDPINKDSIVEALMPRLMEQLDPHSTYISAKDMQAVNEPLEGEFDGIGVVFNMGTDTVVVLNIIAGGPSYKAGVLPGDRIITIDGDTVAGRKIEQNKVVERLRGKRGSEVTIGIQRQNVENCS